MASDGTPIEFFVYYLSQNHELYDLLTEDAKLKVQHCVETDAVGKTLGWFVKTGIEEHFYDVLGWVESAEHPNFDEGQWNALLQIQDSQEWQEIFCKLVGAYYTQSYSYNQADSRFKNPVQLYLHLFTLEAMEFMLARIEENNQTYGRGHASIDHPKIKKRALELDEHFDFSVFPRFLHSAGGDDCGE